MARLDLRFVDLEWEIQLQGSYIDMLAAHMPAVVEAERRRLYLVYDAQPEEERVSLEFIEWDLDHGVLTRSFGAASIVGLWATYESSVLEVADGGRKHLGLRLKLADLRGSFLEQAERYFADVLRIPLHADRTVIPHLRDLAEVRHVFAHAHGRAQRRGNDKRKRLDAAVSRHPGLEIVNDVLVADVAVAREFHGHVASALRELFARARSTFSPGGRNARSR